MKPITLKVITLEDVETIFKNRTDMIFDIVIDAFKKYINGMFCFLIKYRRYLIIQRRTGLTVCQLRYFLKLYQD